MAVVASLVLSVVVTGLGFLFLSPGVDFINHFRRLPFFITLILLTVLLTSTAFILLSRWFIDRPIRELIQLMSSAERKDFLVRAPVRSQDVLGRLSESFNLLLERITTLDAFKMETERQLILAQEELKFKAALEEKNRIIEKSNQEIEARLKELSLVYDFSKEISATLEMEELCSSVERFIGDRLGFQEFALLVHDEFHQHLGVTAARGFADQSKIRNISFRSGEGITGKVLESGETVYIPDTGLNRHYLYYKGEKREDGSFLSIPLIFKQSVVGVLNLTRPGANRFSNEEIRFLETLSVELAIALVNAKLYSRTKELSVRDELTQLYNRRHFQEVLPLEIKRAQRFEKSLSLLVIDIDFFKNYNDRYGHLAGDECLKEFVHIISPRIREVDFFARFGGEEFVLVLPNASKQDAFMVADKIRTLVQEHQIGRAHV